MTAAGDVVPTTTIDDLRGRCIARAERITTSTTTTTEIGVLRLDGVPTVDGRLYYVLISPLWLASTVALDVITGRVRYDTVGTAGTTDTILGECGAHQPSLATYGVPSILKFVPSATTNTSFLLSVGRVAGTGNVSIVVAAGHPSIDMMVFDAGPDPGDTGVDI